MLGLLLMGYASLGSAGGDVTAMIDTARYDLAFAGDRVVGCTINATSGNPKIDAFVCEAARTCGDRYAAVDRREACVADKRRELADRVAKNPRWLRF